jgi:hypothetical protein
MNEMCSDECHEPKIREQFSELRGDPSESSTPTLMNRTFQCLFSDKFLDTIARQKLREVFLDSQMITLLQEVWTACCADEQAAVTAFRKQVRYSIMLGKGRIYKQTYREKPKYEEEYLIEDTNYEDDDV